MFSPSLSTALSGMQAATTRLHAAAHSIANANTDPESRTDVRVEQRARAGGGGTDVYTVATFERPGIGDSIAEARGASRLYDLSARLVERSDETWQSTLDMMA